MADITPYEFPDATESDQRRHVLQRLAESLSERSAMMGDKRIENHDPEKLIAVDQYLEAKAKRRNRMFMLGTRHARRS